MGIATRLVLPAEAIPERNLIILSPHFDDVPCMLGGWLLASRHGGELGKRRAKIVIVFSRSNYTVRSGRSNFDRSPERVRQVTGTRLAEDCVCLDRIFGPHGYAYELGLEDECLLRGDRLLDSEFEYPQGGWADFGPAEWEILGRLEARIGELCALRDTAIIVPAAYREHFDHFILREAARRARSKAAGEGRLAAHLYYAEDKPYAGLATEAERGRVDALAREEDLEALAWLADPESLADLIEDCYPSQFEEIYRTGILGASKLVGSELALDRGLDRVLDRVLAYRAGPMGRQGLRRSTR